MLYSVPNNEVVSEGTDTSMPTHSVDEKSLFFNNTAQNQQYQGPAVGWNQPILQQISLQPIPSNACLQPVIIQRINHQPNYHLSYQQQMRFKPTTHNLIPFSCQVPKANSMPNLHGTPGYPPAVIPQIRQLQQQQRSVGFTSPASLSIPGAIQPHQSTTAPIYTVQDRPSHQHIYNGINLAYPGLRILRTQPPILCVDNFLTEYECNFLIEHASDSFGPAPVVGKGAGEVSPSRTSSTCYLAREDVPDILRKISLLTGKPYDHCELPQVGRYLPTQQYLQHYDAFDLSTEDGRRFAMNGGQRTITVLIYLNTINRGGATRFPTLDLDVQPVRGMALVFFPATVDGLLDKMALHAALPAIDTKYVSQVWMRQSVYAGQPSKRLPQPLGIPLGLDDMIVNQQQPPGGVSFFSQQLTQQVLATPTPGGHILQHQHQMREQNQLGQVSEMQF